MTHANSREAYRRLSLPASQIKVARAILNETRHGRTADAYKLEKFAVVRAAWLDRNKGVGEQAKLQF